MPPPEHDPDTKLLSTVEAAKVAGVTPGYITRLCRSKKLAGVRDGRNWFVAPEALEAYLAELAAQKEQIRQELAKQREEEYRQRFAENVRAGMALPPVGPVAPPVAERVAAAAPLPVVVPMEVPVAPVATPATRTLAIRVPSFVFDRAALARASTALACMLATLYVGAYAVSIQSDGGLVGTSQAAAAGNANVGEEIALGTYRLINSLLGLFGVHPVHETVATTGSAAPAAPASPASPGASAPAAAPVFEASSTPAAPVVLANNANGPATYQGGTVVRPVTYVTNNFTYAAAPLTRTVFDGSLDSFASSLRGTSAATLAPELTGNGLFAANGVLNVATSSLASGFFADGGNSFGGSASLGTSDAQPLQLVTDGAPRLTLASTSGAIGVGSTSPSGQLTLDNWTVNSSNGTLTGGNPQFLINGTLDASTETSHVIGAQWDWATLGATTANVSGLRVDLNAGYTGSGITRAGDFNNLLSGSHAFSGADEKGNIGVTAAAQGGYTTDATLGDNIGLYAIGGGSQNFDIGVYGRGADSDLTPAASVVTVGVAGQSGSVSNQSAALRAMIGGAFNIGAVQSQPSWYTNPETAALLLDNNFISAPILIGRANGADAFTITSTGGIVSTSTVNSTNFWQVLNASGSPVLDVDTANGRLGIGTSSPSAALAVAGDGYFSGNLTVGNSLLVQNGSVTLGSASSTLTLGGYLGSSLVPSINKSYDLGSPALFWRNGYLDNLTVNTLTAASTTISGTQSNSFTINSDNATTDTEDMSLIFFRGLVNPNAVLSWNSTLDRFEFNQPALFWNQSSTTTIPSLIARAASGQTADLFQVQNSSGSVLSEFNSAGWLGIGTTTPATQIEIESASNYNRIKAANITIGRVNGALRFEGFNLGSLSFGGTVDGYANTPIGASINARSDYGNSGNNWASSSAASLNFETTPVGSTAPLPRVWITSGGLVGVGDFGDGQDNLTGIQPTNQLQVRLSPEATAKTADFSTLFLDNSATSTTNSLIKSGVRISSTGSWTGTGASNIGLYVASVTGGTNNYDAIFNGSGVVGIGTTSPGARLDVFATTTNTVIRANNNAAGFFERFTALGEDSNSYVALTHNNSGTSNSTLLDIPLSANIQTGANDTGGLVFDTQTVAPIIFGTGGGGTGKERLRIDGVGNVGIGTSTPTSLLQVAGSAPKLTLTDTGAGTDLKHWFLQSSAGSFSIGTTSDALATGSNRALTIDSLGRVALNATPLSADLYINSKNTRGILINNGGALTTGLYLNSGTSAAFLDNQDAKDFTIVNEQANNLIFKTANAERLRITGTGNVGIGTTTPGTNGWGGGTNVTIYGGTSNNSPATLELTSTNVTDGSPVGRLAFTQQSFGATNAASVYGYRNVGNGLLGLRFQTGGADRLTIDGSGNVGLGTTTPDGLTVQKSLSVFTSLGTANVRIGNNGSAPSEIFDNGTDVFTLSNLSGTGFRVSYNSVSTPFMISASGNVGIGTTNPGYALDVSGGFRYASSTLGGLQTAFDAVQDGNYRLSQQTSLGVNGSWGGGFSWVVGNNGTNAQRGASLSMLNAGFPLFAVGPFTGGNLQSLGTDYNNPAQAVDLTATSGNRYALVGVLGTTLAQGTEGDLIALNTLSGGASTFHGVSFGGLYQPVTNGYSSDFVVNTTDENGNTTEKLRIKGTTGYVGIGTTSPSATLSVAGNIYAAGNLSLSGITATSTISAASFNSTDTSNGGYSIGGKLILYASTTNASTLTGISAGSNLTSTAVDNTAYGYQALQYATSTSFNTAVGYHALQGTSVAGPGSYNVAVGMGALSLDAGGIRNVGIGYGALANNSTGGSNIGIGVSALGKNLTGTDNVAIGDSALSNATAANHNVAFGQLALLNTTGSNNISLGYSSLQSNTTGNSNVAVGFAALSGNQSATSTIALGTYAGYGLGSYSNQGSIYIGEHSGYSAQTGSNFNTLLGYYSGYDITTGGYNTTLGFQAGYGINSGTYNLILGASVDAPSPTGSGQLNIGNVLYGTGLYQSATLSSTPVAGGNIGIGTSSPWGQLSVNPNGTSGPDFVIGSSSATSFIVTNGGGVGIGTSSPNDLFDAGVFQVNRNRTVSVNTAPPSVYDLGVGVNGIQSQGIIEENKTGAPQIALNSSGSDFGLIQNSNSTTWALGYGTSFGTLGTSVLSWNTSGYVGIGTSTPLVALDVDGQAHVGAPSMSWGWDSLTVGAAPSSSGKQASIRLSPQNSINRGWYLNANDDGTSAETFSIYDNSVGGPTANRLVINSLGQIGLGTTSPGTNLQIGSGLVASIPNGAGGNVTPQVANVPISGVAGISTGVIDGTNNRRAGFFVNQTNGVWGLGLSYSTGDIPFVITDSSTERLRIDTNGNVGIGTSTPNAPLDVYTNTKTVAAVFRGIGSSGAAVGLGGVGPGVGFLQAYTNDSMVNTTNLALNPSGGNVGIGTSSPGTVLDVYSNSGANRLSFWNGGSNVTPTLAVSNSSGKAVALQAGAAGTSFVFDTTGFFQIGADSHAALVGGTSNGGTGYLRVSSTGGLSLGNAYLGTDPGAGSAIISGNVGVGTTSPWAQLSVNPNGTSGPAFAVGSSTGTSLVVTNGGLVGIGTANPLYGLHVSVSDNTSNSIADFQNPNTGSSAFADVKIQSDTANLNIGVAGSNTGTSGVVQDATYSYLEANNTSAGLDLAAVKSTGVIRFFTGGPSNIVGEFTSAGNFGLGSTNPGSGATGQGGASFASRLLEVYSTGRSVLSIKSDNTNSLATLLFSANNSAQKDVHLNVDANGALRITQYADASAETFSLDANGRLGIGSTTPGAKLSVTGSGTGTNALQVVTSGGLNILTGVDNPTNPGILVGDPSSHQIRIGTTVGGQIDSYYSAEANPRWSISARSAPGGNGYAYLGLNDGGSGTLAANGVAVGNAGTRSLTLYTSDGTSLQERVRVDGSGNVGIGTTSPAAQLTTTGTVQFAHFGAGTLQTDSNGNVTVSSDARLKNIYATFDRGLTAIEGLQPELFHWNAISGLNQNDVNAGFIAQNVQQYIPEAVGKDQRGYLTLQDRPILAAAVNAIKELATTTDQLSMATTSLSTQVAALQLQVAQPVQLPSALAATSISTQDLVATGTVSVGQLAAAGTVDANAFQVPVAPASYQIGSTTVQVALPAETLADSGHANLYALATYALARTQLLASTTDALAARLSADELRISALEQQQASSTPSGSIGTLTLAMLNSALSSAGVFIEDGIAHFKSLAFNDLVVERDASGSSAAATSTIPAGQTEVSVANPHAHADSQVFLTLTSPVTGNWYVKQKGEGYFVVDLSQAQSQQVSFDYLIVQTAPHAALAASQAAAAAAAAVATSTGPQIIVTDGIVQISGTTVTPVTGTASTTTAAATTTAPAPTAPTASSTPAAPAAPADTTPPVVTLYGDASATVPQGGSWTDWGAKAVDAVDGDITSKIVVTGSVDTATPGTYTLTYSATDAAGNTGTAARTVTVTPSTVATASTP